MVNTIVIMQKQALPTVTLYHSSPPFKILPYHKIINKTQLTFFQFIHYNYAHYTFTNSRKKNSERNTQHELRIFHLPNSLCLPDFLFIITWNNADIITCYNNPTTVNPFLNTKFLFIVIDVFGPLLATTGNIPNRPWMTNKN